jgi:PHD/YefM family antitoxin component YafN of YafNO toxin-antitoxin module
MEIEVEVEEACRRWDEMNALAASGVRVVLLNHGIPIGALISQDDYDWLQRQKRLRGETGPPLN